MNTGAKFSACRTWRYLLWRQWDVRLPMINFLMLNPSTADESKNDPTVERCQRRAQMMSYGGMFVTNIFALRSTDPEALYSHGNPVGGDNDPAIRYAATRCAMVVCAWGAHGALHNRGTEVLSDLIDAGVAPYVLALTKDGQPAHPLYLPYSLQPRPL